MVQLESRESAPKRKRGKEDYHLVKVFEPMYNKYVGPISQTEIFRSWDVSVGQ